MARRAVERFVRDLLRGRRPKGFAASEEEAAHVRAAIDLVAAGPDVGEPRAEFVTDLRERMARAARAEQPERAGRVEQTGHAGEDGQAGLAARTVHAEDVRAGGTDTPDAVTPLHPLDVIGAINSFSPASDFPDVSDVSGTPGVEPAVAARDLTGAGAGVVSRPPHPRLSPARRVVVRAGAVAASAFTAGLVADRTLFHHSPADQAADPQSDLAPATAGWFTVLAAADLPEGAVRTFDLGTVTGVVRRTSGRLRAVSDICTHQACRLGLDEARTALVCPCHGATFALSGAPLSHLTTHGRLSPLPRLAVREHHGQIQVYGPVPRNGTEAGGAQV